jgi:hypothetical protein
MNVAQSSLRQPYRIKNSPILAATRRHTMQGHLQRNSLKTHDSDARQVTHNSQARDRENSGRR